MASANLKLAGLLPCLAFALAFPQATLPAAAQSGDSTQKMLDIEERLILSGRKPTFDNVSKVLRGQLKLPSKEELLAGKKQVTQGYAKVENYTYKSGDRYSGETLDGRRHGEGTYHWKEGGSYAGSWKDGKRHGKGRLVTAAGGVYVGEFVDGEVRGKGTYESPKGDTFSGTFNGSLGEGEGTFTRKGGTRQEARWSGGRLELLNRPEERNFGRLSPEDRARAEREARNGDDRQFPSFRNRDNNASNSDDRKSLYLVTWGSADSIRPGELYPARAQTDNASRRRVDQYLIYRIRGRGASRCTLITSGVTVDHYRIKRASFDNFYTRLNRVEQRNSTIGGDTLYLGEQGARKKARRTAERLQRQKWPEWSVMSLQNARDLPPRCR